MTDVNSKIKVTPPKRSIKGVRPEVALKVAQMLEDGRRYFGSSGASLTHQVSNPDVTKKEGMNPTLASIGLQGERDTTFTLKKWIADKPNAVLVDSVHIRGVGEETIDPETGMIEGGDTDHLIFIGDEVILVDTKRWKKKSNYTVADNGEVLRANKSFPGGRIRMSQAVHLWLDYLDIDASITAMICINAEETVVFRNRNWYTANYRLVEIDRFLELLDTKWDKIEDYDKNHINSTLVSQAVLNTVKPFDERSKVFDMKSLADFR